MEAGLPSKYSLIFHLVVVESSQITRRSLMKRLLLLIVLLTVSVSVFAQRVEQTPSLRTPAPERKSFGNFSFAPVAVSGGGKVVAGLSFSVLDSSPITFSVNGRGNMTTLDAKRTVTLVNDPIDKVTVTQDLAERVSSKAVWGSALVNPVRKGFVWPSIGFSVGQMRKTTFAATSNPTGLDKYKQVYGGLPFGVSPNGSSTTSTSSEFFFGPNLGVKIALGPLTVYPQYIKALSGSKDNTFLFSIGPHF